MSISKDGENCSLRLIIVGIRGKLKLHNTAVYFMLWAWSINDIDERSVVSGRVTALRLAYMVQ